MIKLLRNYKKVKSSPSPLWWWWWCRGGLGVVDTIGGEGGGPECTAHNHNPSIRLIKGTIFKELFLVNSGP